MAMFEIHNPSMHNCHLSEVHGNQYNNFMSFAEETGINSAGCATGASRALTHFSPDERETIAEWLSPFNFETHQATTFRQRADGTGKWLLKSTTFKEWRHGTSRTLFCPGIRKFHCVVFLLQGLIARRNSWRWQDRDVVSHCHQLFWSHT
jgi:hypothetical protein